MHWDKAFGGLFAGLLVLLGIMVAAAPSRNVSVTRRLDAVTADLAAARADLAAIKTEIAATRRDIAAGRSNFSTLVTPAEVPAPAPAGRESSGATVRPTPR